MNVQRGQVWWATVPFNDAPGAKRRPVLVVGFSDFSARDDRVILIAPITGFGSGASPKRGDVELVDWASFGLIEESWVRARRIWGADPKMLDKRKGAVGDVSDDVMSQVLTEISRMFR